MKTQKIQAKFAGLEKEYARLKKDFEKSAILHTENNNYLASDKEAFLAIWKRYMRLFEKIRKLVPKTRYRKYFLFIDYNKFVLRKYLLVFYFNMIIDTENIFWKHEAALRCIINDNTPKDYEYFSKYIYAPRFVRVINTPNLFLSAFRRKMKIEIHELLMSGKVEINNEHRLTADYHNLFHFMKYRYDKILYRIIRSVGLIIAKTRFTSRTEWRITDKNLKKYLKIARPWDIMLTRGNWNASNISIPWFWKHMSMYLGTWKYLKKNYKKKYTKDLLDDEHYLIEATSAGILIVSMNHISDLNDYLWVSRTTFSEKKIERAIKNSFHFIGSEYDFIFNFYSDKNLVCTELIMKSYAKANKDDEWIEIELQNIWSGLVFPPNNFIDLLSQEQGEKDTSVEPLFFIDSLEKKWENFISTPEKLLESRKRSRLSIFLK